MQLQMAAGQPCTGCSRVIRRDWEYCVQCGRRGGWLTLQAQEEPEPNGPGGARLRLRLTNTGVVGVVGQATVDGTVEPTFAGGKGGQRFALGPGESRTLEIRIGIARPSHARAEVHFRCFANDNHVDREASPWEPGREDCVVDEWFRWEEPSPSS